MHAYLNGEPAHFHIGLLIQPMLFLSLLLVTGGIGLGWWVYRKMAAPDRELAAEPDPLEQLQPAVFRFLENKMWLDQLYQHSVIALAKLAARLSDWMDRNVWDGFVRLTGQVGQLFGIVTSGVDEQGINASVDETTAGTRGLGRLISTGHTGQIQTYLSVIAVGMLALLILYAWLT
jgi:hypothetical protein